jgi:hypothetical protein
MSNGVKMSIDVSGLQEAVAKGKTTRQDLLNIRGAGAKIIINKQRELVPIDTGATKTSIMSHIITATAKNVVDDVGPETKYAPVIEYGDPSNPNYPIQSFIRPSVAGEQQTIINNVCTEAFKRITSRWAK